jgi:hypothetical protein
LWRGGLTRLGTLERLPAGARHTVTVAVENRSHVCWGRGPDAAPLVQIGTRWLADDGVELEHGLHTALPADLPARGSLDVPVHVRAPERPGSYRLSLDLVHEHVRWFDNPIEWRVEVPPARRVALIGRGRRLEQALDRIQFEPELEPVLVEQGAALTPERFGHRRAPGLGTYLLAGIDARIGPGELARLSVRTAKLLRRARRLQEQKPAAPLPHGAEECLLALAGCERLLIAGVDWEPGAAPTRQLWRLAVTAAVARRLGLAVEVETEPSDDADLLDRLLARLVRRRAASGERSSEHLRSPLE